MGVPRSPRLVQSQSMGVRSPWANRTYVDEPPPRYQHSYQPGGTFSHGPPRPYGSMGVVPSPGMREANAGLKPNPPRLAIVRDEPRPPPAIDLSEQAPLALLPPPATPATAIKHLGPAQSLPSPAYSAPGPAASAYDSHPATRAESMPPRKRTMSMTSAASGSWQRQLPRQRPAPAATW